MSDTLDFTLNGKVVIVTGAAPGGIGEGYARAISQAGARVVAADINEPGAKSVAQAITDDGGEATAVAVDIGDQASCDALAAAAVDAYGRLDGLVNNAAIFRGMQVDSLLSGDFDHYLHFLSINFHGALRCVRACYQAMAESGGGAVVNQSSTASYMPGGMYGLAKHGVNGLTRELAMELGGMNIRVNAIAPGPTESLALQEQPAEMVDALIAQSALKRRGSPMDLAGACVFLLSEASSWMSGQVLTVDGGQIFRI